MVYVSGSLSWSCFFFFKQKTAYELRISDWSSDVCSSDLFVRDPLDMTAALLARCAGAEPFFSLSEQIFAYQPTLFEKAQALGESGYKAAVEAPPEQRFIKLAQGAGLIQFVMERGISEDQAKQCLSDNKAAEKLADQVQKANQQ